MSPGLGALRVAPGGRLNFGSDRADGCDVDQSCAGRGGEAKFFGLFHWVPFLIVDLAARVSSGAPHGLHASTDSGGA